MPDSTAADGYPRLATCLTSAAARVEGGAPAPSTDVNATYTYTGHTAQFFQSQLGIDLTALIGLSASDGKKIRSTVRYCLPKSFEAPCPFANAFWTGRDIFYGAGFPRADDIVAHELTHGVTQKTAQLAYWYQSGAINESMSDVFSELVDLTNPDSEIENPWVLGESAPFSPDRDMRDPTRFGDPDRMTSPYYASAPWTSDEFDNGGVHDNSGVGNKAAYLIARPSSEGPAYFNGESVTGMGYAAAAKIYYQALTMLTSGADYADLYDVLPQACVILADARAPGITADACAATVAAAVRATEMNKQPTTGAKAPEATVCPTAGATKKRVFFDGFESGLGNWVRSSRLWSQIDYYARSGTKSMAGLEPYRPAGEPTHIYATLAKTFTIPSGAPTYLRFDHDYLLAHTTSPLRYHAGARLEYSVSGGTWRNAAALPWMNGPSRTIQPYDTAGRPLTQYKAFGGDSHGYQSSRVDLSSLAGKAVKLRWRITADPDYALAGWVVDNVDLYVCGGPTPTEPRSVAATGGFREATVRWAAPLWPGDGGVTAYRITVTPGDRVIDGIGADATSHVVDGLAGGTSYSFHVRAVAAGGESPPARARLIGTRLSVGVSASSVSYGSPVTISGKATRVDTGTGASGWTMKLQMRKPGTAWTTLTSTRTTTGGAYAFTRKPTSNQEFRVLYSSGSSRYLGSLSSARAVTVKQTVTGAFADPTVSPGATATFAGSVAPDHAGMTVFLQRLVDGAWTTVAEAALDASSAYAFSVTHGAGSFDYRVRAPGHGDHAFGYSPVRTLTVG